MRSTDARRQAALAWYDAAHIKLMQLPHPPGARLTYGDYLSQWFLRRFQGPAEMLIRTFSNGPCVERLAAFTTLLADK